MSVHVDVEEVDVWCPTHTLAHTCKLQPHTVKIPCKLETNQPDTTVSTHHTNAFHNSARLYLVTDNLFYLHSTLLTVQTDSYLQLNTIMYSQIHTQSQTLSILSSFHVSIVQHQPAHAHIQYILYELACKLSASCSKASLSCPSARQWMYKKWIQNKNRDVFTGACSHLNKCTQHNIKIQ